jgi:hypothetical protein
MFDPNEVAILPYNVLERDLKSYKHIIFEVKLFINKILDMIGK